MWAPWNPQCTHPPRPRPGMSGGVWTTTPRTRCSTMMSRSVSFSPFTGSTMSFRISLSTHSRVTTAPLWWAGRDHQDCAGGSPPCTLSQELTRVAAQHKGWRC